MDMQIIAGSLSSLIFAAGTLNMVIKAWRTKDMRSYSVTMLILNNIGNVVYWAYVASLPFGPIYLMHGFYTVASFILLGWWLLFQECPQTAARVRKTMALMLRSRPRTHVIPHFYDTSEHPLV